jgi:hypothetical protein
MRIALRAGAAAFAVAAAQIVPGAAREPDSIEAIEPGGPGVLTKCRNWLVTSTCNTYHHIRLPSRIAVGDTFSVSFGSHPKEFQFFVARITLEGGHCAILSEAHGDRHEMDKINVAPCYPAGTGR